MGGVGDKESRLMSLRRGGLIYERFSEGFRRKCLSIFLWGVFFWGLISKGVLGEGGVR